MGVYPGFTQSRFGTKNASINYGIMFIGFNMSGLFGPIIVGDVVAATGTYNMAFIIAFVFVLIGLILSFVYRNIGKKAV